MSIPVLSNIRSQLTYYFQKIRPARPLPANFNLQASRDKLVYVNAEIDKLVEKYDKSYIQTRKHPDVIDELKLQIIDALIVRHYDSINNTPPFPLKAIEDIFDDVYKETFVNCILPENAIITLQGNELSEPETAFERLIAKTAGPLPLSTVMIESDSSLSFKDATKLSESLSLSYDVPESKSLYNLTQILMNQDRKFRSDEESILCKIAYNKEKIKFLDSQYALLEMYMKRLYCDHFTPEQRFKFIKERKYRLATTCSTDDKTPGSVETLLNSFSELSLNVENSKEALEANGMSI